MVTITQHSPIPWEIVTIDGLFDKVLIDTFIDYVKTNNTGKGRSFSNDVAFKNVKEQNPAMAGLWWEALGPCLPKAYKSGDGVRWSYEGVPDYVMYATIEAGQRFNIHTDTGCVFEPTKNLFSKYTVLTYLNDDYGGGHTRFYTENFEETVTIQPVRGRTLLFDIDRFHAGLPVETGVKHWMGTELVCRNLGN